MKLTLHPDRHRRGLVGWLERHATAIFVTCFVICVIHLWLLVNQDAAAMWVYQNFYR